VHEFFSVKLKVFDSEQKVVVKVFVVQKEGFLVDFGEEIGELVLVARFRHPGVRELLKTERVVFPFLSRLEFNHERFSHEPVPAVLDGNVNAESSRTICSLLGFCREFDSIHAGVRRMS